ncbi:hypothetical protein AB5J56_15970 [Streptomyces sp. R21]|uniref:Uncharacterized protein n=1 Tax=Streptomyces sp. R21 TaxID=3238627 RepID=A0AB39P4V8_9ACTN
MRSKEDSKVCPVCGQPVEALLRRHKTLGVFVPDWGPGPCRNPKCERYDQEGHGEPEQAAARNRRADGTAEPLT